MIPKIIHYCWFGGEKPNKIKKRIMSWQKKLPDYQFIEWNEQTFDVSRSTAFVKEAYNQKKWAFVSDYVRLFALVHYGGIYLDTDVQVINSFDDYLNNQLFFSYESEETICTAVIGSCEDNHYLKMFMATYNSKTFCLNGELDMTPNSKLLFNFLKENNLPIKYDIPYLSDKISVYKRNVFCAKDIHTYKLDITDNTVSIHHLDASWYSTTKKILRFIKKILMSLLNIFR